MFSILLFVLFGACNNDDVAPAEPINFSMDPLSVLEGDDESKTVFLSLRLDKNAAEPVIVLLRTKDNTAIAGEDYVGFNSQRIEFSSGSRQANCKIEILGDEDFEKTEEFIVEAFEITGARLQVMNTTVIIENDDLSTDINIPSSGYSTPNRYDNMELVWEDEFNLEALNEDDWTFEIGNGSSGWGNNELEYYRKENTFFKEGNLVIQAREESFGGFQYTSSRIITKDKYEFNFGRIDIRAVIPEGQGIWPALWMLGANINEVGWPKCGEIDIMELVGHRPSTVHGTVHYPNPNGDRVMTGTETSLAGSKKFSQEFHVFSLIWKEDSIQWLLDDKQFHVVNREILGTQNPYPFNDPFFFIFNVAVGGDWPGSPDATTSFPQNMIVDYIRVFQEK